MQPLFSPMTTGYQRFERFYGKILVKEAEKAYVHFFNLYESLNDGPPNFLHLENLNWKK